MSVRRKILLILLVAAAAILARRKLAGLVAVWGNFINDLFQTDLDTYTPEDMTWSIFTQQHATEPQQHKHQDERNERLRDNRGYPIYLGTIWNWVRRNAVRREVQRNGHETELFHRQTAS